MRLQGVDKHTTKKYIKGLKEQLSHSDEPPSGLGLFRHSKIIREISVAIISTFSYQAHNSNNLSTNTTSIMTPETTSQVPSTPSTTSLATLAAAIWLTLSCTTSKPNNNKDHDELFVNPRTLTISQPDNSEQESKKYQESSNPMKDFVKPQTNNED